MTERDTHFAGFAKLLWHEVRKTSFDSPGFSEYQQLEKYLQLLIAQRAYDLVYFLLDKAPYHSGSFDTGYGTSDEIRETIEHLPDLTQWPESPTAE